MKFIFACVILAIGVPCHAQNAACHHPDALGTSRILKINTKDTVGIGHGFPALGLAHREIILTFDDGPMPDTTPQILDTLAKDCIQATFFMIGKRADAHPELVKRVKDAGHSIGSHSYTHRELNKLPYEEAAQDIEHGFDAVEKAEFGSVENRPRLVRFPGFKSTPELVDFVHSHDGTVVNTNMSPADWRGQPAPATFDRLKALLDRQDRGIILLHDSQKNTVVLLPMIIAELKARHMRIVHLEVE